MQNAILSTRGTSQEGFTMGSRGILASAAILALLFIHQNAFAGNPPIRILTLQEIEDMIAGSGIYCSRGYNTQAEIDQIREAISDGKTFTMIALEDVPDDWVGFTSFWVGGGGAWPEVIERYESVHQPLFPKENPAPEPILSNYLGVQFQVTFSSEVGQIVGSLMTASRYDIPLIDGDPSARCVPEVQMSPFWLNSGITRAPFAGLTTYGDAIIVPKVRDEFRVEDMTRALAMGSGGAVYVTANALPGSVLKKHLAPGFHSQSGKLGQAAREAVAQGRDPVAAIVSAGDGYLLFKGTVTRSETRGERGFGFTDAYIQGLGEFAGSEYKIYNKNENMVAWLDGKLNAAAPDIIAAVDPKTGWAVERGERGKRIIGSFLVGQEVAIVGFRAASIWRTAKGIEAQQPRHFGIDEDYVPIEELQGDE